MLAVATGWTLDYIDSLSREDFDGMMALNYVEPFTHNISARREGLLVTEVMNSRRKKQLKVSELFPYLSDEPPEWLMDQSVKVAKTLINRHEEGCARRKQTPTYDFVQPKIIEEIELERKREEPNKLKIHELNKLLERIENGKNGKHR